MSNPPDYFFNQAAALPVMETEEGLKVILISTHKGNWTIPKGVIDPGDTPQEAALREAWEEAGLEGEMEQVEFDRFTQKKWGGECTIRVFRMNVETLLDEWPEDVGRKRVCLSLDEASEMIVKRQKPILEKLVSQQ